MLVIGTEDTDDVFLPAQDGDQGDQDKRNTPAARH